MRVEDAAKSNAECLLSVHKGLGLILGDAKKKKKKLPHTPKELRFGEEMFVSSMYK